MRLKEGFFINIQDLLKQASPTTCTDFSHVNTNISTAGIGLAVHSRTLIGGVHIHLSMFWPTSFFLNKIQIYQFEKKSVGQNINICTLSPINILAQYRE